VRHVTLTLALIALVVCGVPLLLYLAQDRLIFFPRPMPEARRAQLASRADVDSVYITAADGARLHAWHVRADRDAPLVLYFGGNAEDVSAMIDVVRSRLPSTAWLLTDYRGYGSSVGAPSERVLYADAIAWFDHVVQGFGAERIFVLGRSIGSAPAVLVAAERRVAGVIAVTPFDSLTAVAAHYYPYLPVRWLLRHPFDSLALAPRVPAPLLCLVASADEIVPTAHSRRLYDAWQSDKTWVELDGARHNTTDDSPLFWASIERFLATP
jgi:alpha-beta hydrolase superfamily lysophospholipase